MMRQTSAPASWDLWAMDFEGGGNALQQHQQLQQQQEHQQNQLWQQLGQINSNNLMRSALMGANRAPAHVIWSIWSSCSSI